MFLQNLLFRSNWTWAPCESDSDCRKADKYYGIHKASWLLINKQRVNNKTTLLHLFDYDFHEPFFSLQVHPFIKDDFALLVLRKKHKRPFLPPVAVNASSAVETRSNVYFSAFDDAETQQNLMYRVCKVKGESYGLLYQECSTENGASGAGVYMQVYDLIQKKWDRVVSDYSEVIELSLCTV